MNAPLQSPSPDTFLRQHSPFDRLEDKAFEFLVANLDFVTVPANTTVVAPELGIPESLHILVAGKVVVYEADGTGSGDELMTQEEGECFPIGALTARRLPAFGYTTATEASFYRLPVDAFHQLMAMSAVFSHFCSSYLASLVSQSRKQLQLQLTQQATEQQSMNTELRQLIKREPIAVSDQTTILQAVERMGELRLGSVIVVDDQHRPVGIFTQSDVLRRVVLPRLPLDEPIASVMSRNPHTLPETDRAYDAVLAMAVQGIRHVLTVDEVGRLTGVISERDLFALQRVGLRQIRQSIESAEGLTELKQAGADVRSFAFNMLAQGVGAEQLTQFISALNDGITTRIIELNLRNHDLYGIEWAWLAFGSEGREEQTLSTDQDNGIVYVCSDIMDREQTQLRFLDFARDVNRDLDACGFTLCKGNIMAGNPEWCLTLDEWKEKFSSWLRTPQPEALLNSTIFFDLRALYGQGYLADQMYKHLFSQSQDNTLFQRMMARNALDVEPPLGIFRDFVTETDGSGSAFIDLKKSGSRLFVDVARVLALTHGVYSANTVKRLRRVAKLAGIGGDVEAIVDSFNFIQLLRLRHQYVESEQGRPGDNRVVPAELNQLDRRILKEAFRQAKQLQQRLKLDYQL